jgi:hypothetical protein
MKHPESLFTCGAARGTIVLSERERGKNMWTVFNKNTGKVVKEGLVCEVDCEMWIAAQANAEELAYAPF